MRRRIAHWPPSSTASSPTRRRANRSSLSEQQARRAEAAKVATPHLLRLAEIEKHDPIAASIYRGAHALELAREERARDDAEPIELPDDVA
jgi:hypothetical protein